MPNELLSPGTELLGHTGVYRVVKPLGLEGATSQVFLVQRDEDEHQFALKLQHQGLSAALAERFDFEMRMLQLLRHGEEQARTSHIPRIVECTQLKEPATQQLTETLGRPFILMDLAPGVDLETKLEEEGQLSEGEAVEILRQFAEVLVVVHQTGYTYKDMKLQNLFWDAPHRALMVVDWNVLEKGLGALGDDLARAAAYLFRIATGRGLTLVRDDSGHLQAENRRFRRLPAFENLTAGTRHLLLKALHRDPGKRFGGPEAPPLVGSREFLDALKHQAARFERTVESLLQKAQAARQFGQWRDALEELEVAESKIDDPTASEDFDRIQRWLGEAREQMAKIGRSEFQHGMGRYRHKLFAEALRDFEQALLADSSDEEARLYAILARLANRLGSQGHQVVSQELKEVAEAILAGSDELARQTLELLRATLGSTEEWRSLMAEVEVRKAIADGRLRLAEGALDAAEAEFRKAYERRSEVLYAEQLEETLGELSELYHRVGQIKALVAKGDTHLKQGRYRDAMRRYWEARNLAEGGRKFDDLYRRAASFLAIDRARKQRDFELAVERSERAWSQYVGDPMLESLRDDVRRRRSSELLDLAAQARTRSDTLAAREAIAKAVELTPQDARAQRLLGEIQEDLDQGYRDKLAGLRARLRGEERSVALCREVARELRALHLDATPEGQTLLGEVQTLERDVQAMEHQLEKLERTDATLETLSNFLKKCEAERLVFERGKPASLLDLILEQSWQRRLDDAEDRLRQGDYEAVAGDARHWTQSATLDDHLRPRVTALENLATEAARLDAKAKSLRGDLDAIESKPLESLKKHRDLVSVLEDLDSRLARSGILGTGGERQQQRFGTELGEHLARLGHRFRRWATAGPLSPPELDLNLEVSQTQKTVSDWLDDDPMPSKVVAWCQEAAALWDWLHECGWDVDRLGPTAVLKELPRLTQDADLQDQLSALRSAEVAAVVRELEDPSRDNTSPLIVWGHAYFVDRQLESELLDLVRTAPREARRRLGELSDVSESWLQVVEMAEEAEALVDRGTELPNLPGEELKSLLDETDALNLQVGAEAHLQEGRLAKALGDFESSLRKEHERRIAEQRDHFEALSAQLVVSEDLEARLSLNRQLEKVIAEARPVDPEVADHLERERVAVREQLLQDSQQALRKSGSVSELQRRVSDARAKGESVESVLGEYRDKADWRDAVKHYRVRRSNVQTKLRSIDKIPETERYSWLLEQRLMYGEFPEISEALGDLKAKAAKEGARHRFDQLVEQRPDLDRWQSAAEALDQIDSDLLDPEQQSRYENMVHEVARLSLLGKDLPVGPMDDLLDNKTGLGSEWLEALSWAASPSRRPEHKAVGRLFERRNLVIFREAFDARVIEQEVSVHAIKIYLQVDAWTRRLGVR